MNALALFFPVILAFIATANVESKGPDDIYSNPDHYGQDHSERGAGQHEDLDQPRVGGNTAGTDLGGYGDYGSYVHNGWRSYAKGKEHVSYYENDNDDGRHGEVSQDCGHNCYGDDQGQEHHGYGKEFARHDFEENGHGSHYHHDFDPHHNYGHDHY